jgi:hypothetical protein
VQLTGDALALVFLRGEDLLGHLLEQPAMVLQDVQHGIERVTESFDVGVAEQNVLGPCAEVAGGHAVDRSFQRV